MRLVSLQLQVISTDDYAKNGSDELSTKMHCVLLSNSYRIGFHLDALQYMSDEFL